MIIFMHFIFVYLLIGIGFSISAWLEASETQIEKGKPPEKYFSKAGMCFLFFWIIFAVYCYRAEIRKTIPKIDFNKYK